MFVGAGENNNYGLVVGNKLQLELKNGCPDFFVISNKVELPFYTTAFRYEKIGTSCQVTYRHYNFFYIVDYKISPDKKFQRFYQWGRWEEFQDFMVLGHISENQNSE